MKNHANLNKCPKDVGKDKCFNIECAAKNGISAEGTADSLVVVTGGSRIPSFIPE